MKNPQRQVMLASQTKQLVCYLDDNPKLKVGNFVTLKDHEEPKRQWEIVYVSPHVREKSSIKTTWSNNI